MSGVGPAVAFIGAKPILPTLRAAMSSPEPSRKQRRDAAREERRAQEAAAAAAAVRKRRLVQFGGVIAAAVVVVVVAIIASGGGDKKAKAGAGEVVAGQKDIAAMLGGIPQDGLTLGNPKAKTTLVEFADPQCPVCKDFSDNYFPRVVEDQVRTGKVKVDLRLLTFIDNNAGGTDSQEAALTALAAAKQDKLWNFIEVLYRNQGAEGSGWVTDQLMQKVAQAIGADWNRLKADRAAAADEIAAAKSAGTKYGINGTPTFLSGASANDLTKVKAITDADGNQDYRKLNDALGAATPAT